MRNTVIWSYLGLVALATSGLVAGCDSDAKLAKSALGESCDNTADCDDGLKCVEGTCYKKSSVVDNSGGDGNTAGVPGVTGPVPAKPPVLGGDGESCSKRADCQDGLGCFNGRCQKSVGGEGGAGPVAPALGGIGETCGLTSDCESGLACRPLKPALPELTANGTNSVGVCTLLDSGVVPSGKVCGAECAEAADCCELPIAQQTATGAASCANLAALIEGIPDCAVATGVNGVICLAYDSYCHEDCGSDTWACENGACKYTAECTKTTQVVGGCPTFTRGGTAIPACNTTTSKCEPVAPTAGCEEDDDCTDEVVVDYPADTCVEGECTCHVATGGCYRKCGESIDCEAGYVCNDDALCVPRPECTEDVYCIRTKGDIRAKCTDEGVCQVPCAHDIDCNENGLIDSEFSQVCSDGVCVGLGCQSDDECGAFPTGGGVKSFCTEPATPATTEIVKSAITD